MRADGGPGADGFYQRSGRFLLKHETPALCRPGRIRASGMRTDCLGL